MITFRTSSLATELKKLNLGKSGAAGRVNESVLEKESLILFCLRKVTKQLNF